jgi:hypothetical protein
VATLKEAAEFYRLAIACGLLKPADAIRWADAIILDSPEPPIEIIEVASTTRADAFEMMDRLAAVRGPVDHARIVGLCLVLARSRLQRNEIDICEAAGVVCCLGGWPSLPLPDELRQRLLSECDQFVESWDGYFLDRDEATCLLVEFLDAFASFEPEPSTILPERAP